MTFRPMLASPLTDPETLRFPCVVSPKIDGIRCIILRGTPLTRSLKPVPNRFIRAALSGLPDLDGELVVGPPNDPKAWNDTTSAVMSHDGEPDFAFYVFDDPSSARGFLTRFTTLTEEFKRHRWPHVQLVEHHTVNTIQELSEREEAYVKAGYEGLMIRSCNGPYKNGRSSEREGYLLKMKRFDDSEAVVIGIKERMRHVGDAKINALGLKERDSKKENLEPADTLGALICRWLDQSRSQEPFDVGTGFTDEQRAFLWENRPIDAVIRLKHQGYTIEGDPRFPIFQGFRDERDMS